MNDLNTYITKMALGLAGNTAIENAKWGNPKKKKRKTSYRDYHIVFEITEDDLP